MRWAFEKFLAHRFCSLTSSLDIWSTNQGGNVSIWACVQWFCRWYWKPAKGRVCQGTVDRLWMTAAESGSAAWRDARLVSPRSRSVGSHLLKGATNGPRHVGPRKFEVFCAVSCSAWTELWPGRARTSWCRPHYVLLLIAVCGRHCELVRC